MLHQLLTAKYTLQSFYVLLAFLLMLSVLHSARLYQQTFSIDNTPGKQRQIQPTLSTQQMINGLEKSRLFGQTRGLSADPSVKSRYQVIGVFMSDDPKRRRVVVENQGEQLLLREGESTPDGYRVESITSNSAVLSGAASRYRQTVEYDKNQAVISTLKRKPQAQPTRGHRHRR